MKIQSNTQGKINKILNGKVFSNPLTFITELFQNATRARAKNVIVQVIDDKITFSDDGVGLKNPECLLTFDYSEWDSTNEGFGLGFWSVIGIPNIKGIIVKSNKYQINIDIEKLKITSETDVIMLDEKMKGFSVEIKSDYISENKDTIIESIIEEGALLDIDLIVNDEYIDKKDLLSEVDGEFVKQYNNRLFSAALTVSPRAVTDSEFYYENRFVDKNYYSQYISGVILLKQGSVDLREPDRKTLVYNAKREKLMNKIDEVVIDLYKNFLNDIHEDGTKLNEYADAINEYLDSSYFSKYLTLNSNMKDDKNTIKELNEQDKLEESKFNSDIIKLKDMLNNSSTCISKLEKSKILSEEKDLDSDKKKYLFIDNEATSEFSKEFKYENKEKFNEIHNSSHTIENCVSITKEKRQNNSKVNFKKALNNRKNFLWVEAANAETFSDSIALAKYNGLKVIIAPNVLFESALKDMGIPHIVELDSSLTTKSLYSRITCITNKEENFLKLLNPIILYFNLPKDIFQIANIKADDSFTYNDRIIKLSKGSNSTIIAETTNNHITFNRDKLYLKNFNISNQDRFHLGIHELKCIMWHVNTIAHELAHYLYKTKDNTDNHRKYERMLEEKIIKIYNEL